MLIVQTTGYSKNLSTEGIFLKIIIKVGEPCKKVIVDLYF